MNYILLYILQSSISIIIFYAFYALLFKREAYFSFNRYYLLFAIFTSLLLPLMSFSIPEFLVASNNAIIAAPVYSLVEYTLSEVTIYGGDGIIPKPTFSNSISFFNVMMIIYFAGVVVSSLLFIFRLYQLSNFLKYSNVKVVNGLNFVFTKPGIPVFSFLNYIFIDKKLFENKAEVEKIIAHENIHIRQKHTIDLIIAEVITIVQWFNPLAYILKKSIKENHEFIADSDVITSYPDAQAYSSLLIQHSSIIKSNILTHNFSYSLLKRRLFMIKKTKNPLRFSFKLVVALLALNMVFFACSGPVQKDDIDISSQNKTVA